METKRKILAVLMIAMNLWILGGLLSEVQAQRVLHCGGNERQYAEQIENLRPEDILGGVVENPWDDPAYNREYKRLVDEYRANSCQLKDVFIGFARVINALIALAGLFVVYRLTAIGFGMIIAVGNEGAVKAQKEALKNAILGLILVLIAFAIVNTLFGLFSVRLGLQGTFNFPYNPYKELQ